MPSDASWRVVGILAVAVLVYLSVPLLFFCVDEKVGAAVAVGLGGVVMLSASALLLVLGRHLSGAVLRFNLGCLVTHAILAGLGVATLVSREPLVRLPTLVERDSGQARAAEQAHAADGRRDV